MNRFPLGETGIQVPALSFGAASLGSVYHPVSQDEANAAVEAALGCGLDYFDVAPYYGLTTAEAALGKALSGVRRESYHLATKVGRYGDKDWDFSADATRRSVEASLKRLGVDVIDVIQCHDIECGDRRQLVAECLPALRRLREEGVVRFIGITGYELDVIETVAIAEKVDTVMTYCTYTLQDRRLAPVARRLAAAGIGVLNASPLGMGLLTNRGAPDWHPGNERVIELANAAARLCRAAGGDISDLAMRFALSTAHESDIATTVVGTANAGNVRANAARVGHAPDPQLMKAVEAVLEPVMNAGWDVLPGNGGKAGR
ncbi:L-galactose dehydrogenase [Consotaella salsifontis]|uniref:L-galactose dehydrogenase n=2 Tax=Consotaella salsifontis TaxID=1365950 RepID=A0A1T4S876_9HYPH|nr:L-galactose dehydrogenase [Consotaella salsifontis]